MSTFEKRLHSLETIRQRQAPGVVNDVELSHLSAAQLERAAELRDRIDQVGVAGLTPDELLACAEIRELLEAEA